MRGPHGKVKAADRSASAPAINGPAATRRVNGASVGDMDDKN